MLQRLFTHPVELTINDRAVMFNSVEDFEFALDARTAIPLDKITNTIKASLQELKQEAEAIAVAAEELSKIMSQFPETSSGITMRLKSTDSSIFSKDNGWRDIITGLNGDESFETCKYKQVALKTYLCYLSNRLGMIKSIQTELEKSNASEGVSNKKSISLSQAETGSFEVDEGLDPTLIDSKEGMAKMPKGKSIMFEVKNGDKFELVLSKYPCQLLIGDSIKFVDSNDVEYPINIDRNRIGRGQDCSVKFREGMQEVSRLHLMIVNHNDKKLELTDLSTHGTYYQHLTS